MGDVRGAFSIFGVAVIVVLAGGACSRKPDSPVRTSATPPGVVTVRFANPMAGDVFVDAEYGENVLITDKLGRQLGRPEFCGTDCETCNRPVCGAPAAVVRRIPEGGTWEMQWQGDFFESAAGDKGCTCMRRRLAEDGTYTVTVKGRAAATHVGAPMGSDPNVVSGSIDESSAVCTATGPVTLGVAPSTADIAWSCTRP